MTFNIELANDRILRELPTCAQTTTIPANVIAWCRQHDWFHSVSGNVITSTDGDAIAYSTFQSLREWAGY